MLNVEKITFRCKTNPVVLYTPEYLHDVEGMRRHPEYEEVDKDGNVVADAPKVEVAAIPVSVAPPPAAKKKTVKKG